MCVCVLVLNFFFASKSENIFAIFILLIKKWSKKLILKLIKVKNAFLGSNGRSFVETYYIVSKYHNKSGKHVNINSEAVSKCKYALKITIYCEFTTFVVVF